MKSIERRKSITIFMAASLISLHCVLRADELSPFEQIDPSYYETNVSKLIEIKNTEDIIGKRKALIRYIWADEGFPSTKLPGSIEENIKDDRYAELFKSNLKQIDKISVNMDSEFNAIIYHFIPKKCNEKLIIYHQGHSGDFIKGINTIRACLDRGYSVMGFSMPLMGMNNQPTIEHERFGKIKLTNHEHLKLLKSPIKYFIEPLTVAINYAAKFKYHQIHMIGISGGGWTTTLYAAIDPRILHSFPVAGSVPLYLRTNRDWGDYEQTLPQLYVIANYLELYIIGSHGNNRKQLQILNKYDSCCFAGIKYQMYENVVKEAVAKLGKGEFEIFLDDTHKEHKISSRSLDVIFADLKNTI